MGWWDFGNLNIPKAMLPVRSNSEIYVRQRHSISMAEVLISGMADQQAASLDIGLWTWYG